jgi:hypothetical protein
MKNSSQLAIQASAAQREGEKAHFSNRLQSLHEEVLQ